MPEVKMKKKKIQRKGNSCAVPQPKREKMMNRPSSSDAEPQCVPKVQWSASRIPYHSHTDTTLAFANQPEPHICDDAVKEGGM